jgi:hypothetical protein
MQQRRALAHLRFQVRTHQLELFEACKGKHMATRQELLDQLWKQEINAHLRDEALDDTIKYCRRNPDGPFGDTGAAIERLLTAGVSRRDLGLVLRNAAYEAVFGTLYSLSDPGAEEDDDVSTLYEELLTADPSGMEGRPGSADAVRH